MKKQLIVKGIKTLAALAFCFSSAIVQAMTYSTPQVYHVVIDYANDNFNVSEVSLANGTAPDRNYQPENGFRFDLVSANDEILNSFVFEVPNVICSDDFAAAAGAAGQGCHMREQGTFSLEVPYYPNGRNINIYDTSGKMVAYADVESFAHLCGDGICQENENRGTCSSDCRSGIRDGYCDGAADGSCDADCDPKNDPDCVSESTNGLFWVMALIVLLAIGALAAYAVYRRKKDQNDYNE